MPRPRWTARAVREACWLVVGFTVGATVTFVIAVVLVRRGDPTAPIPAGRFEVSHLKAMSGSFNFWQMSIYSAGAATWVQLGHGQARGSSTWTEAEMDNGPEYLIGLARMRAPWLALPPRIMEIALSPPLKREEGDLSWPENTAFVAIGAGWPRPAFTGNLVAVGTFVDSDAIVVVTEGLYVPPASTPRLSPEDHVAHASSQGIPFRPIWSGLAFDAFVVGVFPLTLLRAALFVPKLVRRIRDRCERCAHPLMPTQSTCPECGWSRRRAVSIAAAKRD